MHINELLNAILNDLEQLKATNILPLNVEQLTSVTDFLVIATGTSSRHVGAIADHLVQEMKEHGYSPLGIESDPQNEWVLVDLGDVVVHIMQKQTRDFYQLEKLWTPHHQLANQVASF